MLQRCYSPRWQSENPAYEGCTVCDEWLRLSIFWKWAEPRWTLGLHLDKDIIVPGNKVYGPEFCCFVSAALNALLTDHRAARGPWPVGVHPAKARFQAHCCTGRERKHLGTFDTPKEAHAVYVQFKVGQIREASGEQDDARIATGLEHHAQLLENSI
jgi:hypothetical protein